MSIFVKALCLLILLTPLSAFAQDKAPTPPLTSVTPKKGKDPSKVMKGMTWKAPKTEKDEGQTKTEETSEEEVTAETEDTNTAPQEELTQGQKLWKKYKDLADKSKAKEEAEKEDNTQDEQTDTDETKEADSQENTKPEKSDKSKKAEPKVNPLNEILEKYKKSQTSGSNMNSRSFGKLDDDEKPTASSTE